MHLELGDIIKIMSIDSPDYHNNVFIITYLDAYKMQITNILNKSLHNLAIKNNALVDSSIQNMVLMKRHDKKGYSDQNNLNVNTWIDIFFSTDIPFIVTGIISNKEEDMIEIKTYVNNTLTNNTIYIDFAYEGIPDNLPIEKIVIRDEPYSDDTIHDDTPDDVLQKIANIDKIIFETDENLGEITLTGKKDLGYRKFGLQMQINDLTEDLLASRTSLSISYIRDIYNLLQRFKELHNNYVTTPRSPFFTEFYHYPWLLPIIANKPYLFYVNSLDIDETLNDSINTGTVFKEYSKLITFVDNIYSSKTYDKPLSVYNNVVSQFHNISDVPTSADNILHTNVGDNPLHCILETHNHSHDSIDSYVIHSLPVTASSPPTNTTETMPFQVVKANPETALNVKSVVFLPHNLFVTNALFAPSINMLNRSFYNIHASYFFKYITSKKYTYHNVEENAPIDHNNILQNLIHYRNNINPEEPFHKYVEKIKPPISAFINNVLPEIPLQNSSFFTVFTRLQHYMIDITDIHYDDFMQIQNYLNLQHDELKRYVLNAKIHDSYDFKPVASSFYKTFIKNNSQLNYYDFNSVGFENITASELIAYMLSNDMLNLFSAVTLSNFTNIIDINRFNEDAEVISTSKNLNLSRNVCNRNYLSNQYHTVLQMNNDNGVEIYFDKEFDPTNYNLLTPTEIESKKTSIDKLIEQYKLAPEDAEYEYESILNKKRVVKPGHFAILYDEGNFKTFKRSRSKIWELTNEFNGVDGNNIFCNIQKSCYNLDNNICASKKNKLLENNRFAFAKTLSEFDMKIIKSKEAFTDAINAKIKNANYLLIQKKTAYNEAVFYYNNKFYELGLTYIPSTITYSPFFDVFQMILGVDDLPEKYEFILKFCAKFTRNHNDLNKEENPHWMYCTKTNTKLVPLFLHKLALAWIRNDNYNARLNDICRTQGVISEDGDKVIDMHSGYIIKNIDLNDDLFGYEPIDTSQITSGILNIHQKIASAVQMDRTYLNYIFNIIDSVSKFMFISFETSSYEYLVNNIIKLYSKNKPSLNEKDQSLSAKQQKVKLEAIEIYHILYFSLAFILLEITCVTPSFAPRRQFPGCIKALDGWPVDDKSNMDALTYVSCVAFNIASKDYPWKIIRSKNFHKDKNKIDQTSVGNIITQFLEKYILHKPEYITKINKKRRFLKNASSAVSPNIPAKKLPTFLPVLQKFDLSFKISLNFSKLTKLQLNSKALFLSIQYLHDMQRVVQETYSKTTDIVHEKLIEQVSSSYNINSSLYAANKDAEVVLDNLFILENILSNFSGYQQKNIVATPIGYPVYQHNKELLSKYTNNMLTCYLFFEKNIHLSDVPEDLSQILNALPENSIQVEQILHNIVFGLKEYNESDNINLVTIELLKSYGLTFTKTNMQTLMNVVNKHNTVMFNITEPIPDFYKIHNLLTFSDVGVLYNDEYFNSLLSEYNTIINNYIENDLFDKTNLDSFKDKLFEHIKTSTSIISEFLTTYSSYKSRDKNTITDFIEKILNSSSLLDCWSPVRKADYKFNISASYYEEAHVKAIGYFKNLLHSLVNIVPNVIINKTCEMFLNLEIPHHWELSQTLEKDIKRIITESMKRFNKYDEHLDEITKIFSDLDQFLPTINTIIDALSPSIVKNHDSELVLLMLQTIFSVHVTNIINIAELGDDDVKCFVANLLYDVIYLHGPDNNFKFINMSYEDIHETVHGIKESEKFTITERLKNMTKDQRQVENQFKQHGLGFWSKGLDSGVRIHKNSLYDEDRVNIDETIDKDDFMASLYKDVFGESNDDLGTLPDDDDIPDDYDYAV